jgi:small GTP-binding protein
MSASNELKIVVVGDGTVGKTCLLSVLTSNEFNWEHIPTIFQNQQHEMKVDGKDYQLDLWDTAGQENFDRLRPLSYKDVDVYIVCFSVNDVNTFDNVGFKWCPELNNHQNGKETRILVGTKADMRQHGQHGNNSLVKQEAIDEIVKKKNFFSYIETSALQRLNIKKPFEAAIRSQRKDPPQKSGTFCHCSVM